MLTHEIAQKYEQESHQNWILQDDNYNKIWADLDEARASGEPNPHYMDMFFKSDAKVWDEFVAHAKDKTCLEVAGGILGIMPIWYHWLKGRKASIDPLLDQCDVFLKGQGRSWFADIELYSKPAEDTIPNLVGQVDGFILWRNGLDHMEDPELGIRTISSYAKPGCMLLLWSDVKHHDDPDDGHKNIGETPDDVEKMVVDAGWEIKYRTPNIHEYLKMVEYGCVAIKK